MPRTYGYPVNKNAPEEDTKAADGDRGTDKSWGYPEVEKPAVEDNKKDGKWGYPSKEKEPAVEDNKKDGKWGYPSKEKITDKAIESAKMETTESTKMPDRKSFKRIRRTSKSLRGILTGESRKERKAKKAAERAASGVTPSNMASESDEEETVYGVDLSEAGSPPRKPKEALPPQESSPERDVDPLPKTPPREEVLSTNAHAIQVVLLLMDPASRRFELLQLEFDSTKAIVGDVLEQIPTSVTEATLREQTYKGVCDRDGVEMINSLSLSEFFHGSEVLLAIPEGTPSKECARLARPILSDPNVIDMLRSNGVDCTPIRDDEAPESTPRAAFPPVEVEKPSPSSFNTKRFLSIVLFGVLAVVSKMGHDLITAPLGPGDEMAPGTWRSRCGLLSFLPSSSTMKKLPVPESLATNLSCDNAGLEMSRYGVLTLYGAGSSVRWRMEGNVCAHDHPSCVEGLVVNSKGKVVIGGKEVHHVTTYDMDSQLSPWPFVDPPKLRVVKGRK